MPRNDYLGHLHLEEEIYEVILDEHLFLKQSFSQEDILLLKYILDRTKICYICERALNEGKEKFMNFIFNTPCFRERVKIEDAIMRNCILLLKRLYLEGFEWNEEYETVFCHFNHILDDGKQYPYHNDERGIFLRKYINLWRSGANHTEVKPVKSK